MGEGSLDLDREKALRRRQEFLDALSGAIQARLRGLDLTEGSLGDLLRRVEKNALDPHTAAEEALSLPELTRSLTRRTARARRELPGDPGQIFLGVDLTSSEKKKTACAVVDGVGRLVEVVRAKRSSDIVALADNHRPQTVAVDAPLGYPRGMDCLEETCACRSVWPDSGRRADREVSALGISIYFVTKRTFIKDLVYRAVQLKADLEERGHHMIEVYPHASKVRLFGLTPPKKTTPAGRLFLSDEVGNLVGTEEVESRKLTHDDYDAIIAAYTGVLHHLGRTDTLGEPDEGAIVIPTGA